MKIYVVGIGAGSADGMTFEARNVLEKGRKRRIGRRRAEECGSQTAKNP